MDSTTLGTTADIMEDSMILGTMEDIGADTIQATGDGMTHGIITTITAAGTTHLTTGRHISEASHTTKTDITASALTQKGIA